MQQAYRIIWYSDATGSDETIAVCNSLAEAQASAMSMVGNPVFWEGDQISVVNKAYVADENGDEITS